MRACARLGGHNVVIAVAVHVEVLRLRITHGDGNKGSSAEQSELAFYAKAHGHLFRHKPATTTKVEANSRQYQPVRAHVSVSGNGPSY